jgi:hypothetical protein
MQEQKYIDGIQRSVSDVAGSLLDAVGKAVASKVSTADVLISHTPEQADLCTSLINSIAGIQDLKGLYDFCLGQFFEVEKLPVKLAESVLHKLLQRYSELTGKKLVDNKLEELIKALKEYAESKGEKKEKKSR